MRKLMIGALTALLVFAVAAPARAADGPAGTSEGTFDPETETWTEDNQVECGEADADDVDLGNGIMVKTEGDQAAPQNGGAIVVCNEGGNDLPVQGRVIAAGDSTGAGYIAADGDADNPNEQSQGYARIDVGPAGVSVVCGDPLTGDTDSANPGPGASQENCG